MKILHTIFIILLIILSSGCSSSQKDELPLISSVTVDISQKSPGSSIDGIPGINIPFTLNTPEECIVIESKGAYTDDTLLHSTHDIIPIWKLFRVIDRNNKAVLFPITQNFNSDYDKRESLRACSQSSVPFSSFEAGKYVIQIASTQPNGTITIRIRSAHAVIFNNQ